ncbi:HERC1 [Symbiodinium sp. CCMP2456]|nr:HERC1 [Symbiodinium sp. CCMP2456]
MSMKEKVESKPVSETKSRAETLQEMLFTKEFYEQDRAGTMKSQTRWRGIFSYFTAFVSAVHSFCANPVKHILGIYIVDDTNIRMAEPDGSSAVYSAMNAIQFVTIRSIADKLCHFRLHQPMVCLANATAATLHAHSTAWFFCCARGLGMCLQALGLVDARVSARFRCGIWVTDSLRANSKLFCYERAALQEQHEDGTAGEAGARSETRLGMHITCGIHKLSLIRRPLVLMVPCYWSTLVRLAHLFEGRAFKQKFREALACVVMDSFKKVEVHTLPSEIKQWQSAAEMVFSSCEPSRRKYIEQGEALYKSIVNSDPSKPAIIHWCLVGGCSCKSSSTEDCMIKVLRACLNLFGRGYPVPLLQRWKHYGPANAFFARGLLLHRILPRVLENMESSRPPSTTKKAEHLLAKVAAPRDEMMVEVDAADHDTDDDAAALPQVEESFAEVNGRRLQQVCKAVRRDSFLDDASIVNMLCAPIDLAINKLMKRTRIVHTLRNEVLMAGASDNVGMASESLRFFLNFASGNFGMDIVKSFLDIIVHTSKESVCKGLGPSPSRAKEVWCGALFGMADSWRRFVHQLDCYPWKLFALCPMTEKDFFNRWSELQQRLSACPCCLDVEITQGLLRSLGDFGSDEPASRKQVYVQVVQLLMDVATYAPLSTDAVEVFHGQLQNVIHKFRGRGKLARACSERSVLHSLVAEHSRALACVKAETLPNARLVSLIERPCPAHQSGEHPVAKQLNRQLRRLCGWNVFSREALRGEVLPKAEYARREKQMSRQWKQMSTEDKSPYEVRAAFETERRDVWLSTALPIGNDRDQQAVHEIGQRMVHKLAYDRLQINYKHLREHHSWKAGLGLGDANGALRADLMETTMTDSEIAAALGPAFKHMSDEAWETTVPKLADCPGTCRSQCGICQGSLVYSAVKALVRGFSRHVHNLGWKTGALLQFWAEGGSPADADCVTAFLAMTVLRPSEHVLVRASTVGNGRVAISLLPDSGLPDFVTSHELFESMLTSQTAGNARALRHKKVCARQLDFDLDAFTPGQEAHSFLEVTVIKEHDRPRPAAQATELRAVVAHESSSESGSDGCASTGSSPSNVGSSGASAPVSDNSDSEDDIVAAPSTTVEETSREVPSILVEVQEQRELQWQQQGSAVERASSSSFFATEIGFCEGDLAKTGRSKCRHCGDPIARGLPRFAYHYNRYRSLQAKPEAFSDNWQTVEMLFSSFSSTLAPAPMKFMLTGVLDSGEEIGLQLIEHYHLKVVPLRVALPAWFRNVLEPTTLDAIARVAAEWGPPLLPEISKEGKRSRKQEQQDDLLRRRYLTSPHKYSEKRVDPTLAVIDLGRQLAACSYFRLSLAEEVFSGMLRFLGEGACELCDQVFGTPDKDTPEEYSGEPVIVHPVRCGAKHCHQCIYNARGSFKKTTLPELVQKRRAHSPLRRKMHDLRKSALRARLMNPGRRQRHELVDIKSYEKRDEQFLEIAQTGTWKSLQKICEEKGMHKLKTEAQQKRFVEKTLKLEVTLDDQKRPGVVFAREDDDVKEVRMGRRLSHSKVQSKEVENREELDALQEKSAGATRCTMEQKVLADVQVNGSEDESSAEGGCSSSDSSCVLAKALGKSKVKGQPKRRLSTGSTTASVAPTDEAEARNRSASNPPMKRSRHKQPQNPSAPATSPSPVPQVSKQAEKQKKIDQIQPTLQQLRAVTVEGMMKATPGCRAADARNKALRGAKLAEEISQIEGQSEEAKELAQQSKLLTDMIEVTDMIRTESCNQAVCDPAVAAKWKELMSQLPKSEKRFMFQAIAEKLRQEGAPNFINFIRCSSESVPEVSLSLSDFRDQFSNEEILQFQLNLFQSIFNGMLKDKGNALQIEDIAKLLPPDTFQPLIARTSFSASHTLTTLSPDAAVWENKTGLSLQVVLDASFLHCLARVQAQIDNGDRGSDGPGGNRVSAADLKLLVAASSKVSTRLRLAIRSSPSLRTAQGHAVNRAQQTCSLDQLLEIGRKAHTDLRELESLLQQAMADHGRVPGISLKPLSEAKKLLLELPDDDSDESAKELRASLATEVSKASSTVLCLSASLSGSSGSLDDLLGWCELQFPCEGMMFQPMSESKCLAWEQRGMLELSVVQFGNKEDREMAKSMLGAWHQLGEFPTIGEGTAGLDLDDVLLRVSKYVTTVAAWGEKSFESQEAPAFFQKMFPALRELSSRMTSSTLATVKAKVFEHKPDLEKMNAVVSEMFPSNGSYASNVRSFLQGVQHLSKVIEQLESVVLKADKSQVISGEHVRSQYDAAVAAFRLDTDLVDAAGLSAKVNAGLHEFRCSVEDLHETCKIKLEGIQTLMAMYEKIIDATTTWDTALMQEVLSMPELETDVGAMQDLSASLHKECIYLGGLSELQVGPEDWLQLFGKLGAANKLIQEIYTKTSKIHVVVAYAELVLHPDKYDAHPALIETGKAAQKLGVDALLPKRLMTEVGRALALHDKKAPQPVPAMDDKKGAKKKDKDKKDRKHKHEEPEAHGKKSKKHKRE